MRAIVFESLGEPSQVLRIEERKVPTPGPGEVLVRVAVRSVNPADLLLVRGSYGSKPSLPMVPGNEGFGVVEALGPGVDTPALGTRVICYGYAGTWQEFMTIPTGNVIPAPKDLSESDGAQAITGPLCAWLMILDRLKLTRNDWLLQTAAGSSLGRVAIQIARLHGIRTVNVVRRQDQVKELEQLGADAVIVTPGEDIVERTRRVTGGRGATGAIEAVGGETATLALQSLAEGSAMLVYGLLSGKPASFDNGMLIFRRLTVSGFWLRYWFQNTRVAEREGPIGALLRSITERRIVLPVEQAFDLSEVQKAVQRAEKPGKAGKVLITG